MYHDILDKNFLQSVVDFQQDKDPKHTLKIKKEVATGQIPDKYENV